ncbi:MAG: YidC/Oxa1 family membrane protein insertase, partial [Oscillospiraceae bacterium]|nr:YidC/Oxa1 family membrane protein insertase [Oscillospiraceae bacterium]
MGLLFTLFAPPLGLLMQLCYSLVKNVGVAIVLFTVIVKVLMFPLSVKQQKTTSKTQIFSPKLKEIQTKYRGNNAKIQEEMAKLSKQGYNPTAGCLPMVVTMLILFGVLGVVYGPMSYFEKIESEQIGEIKNIAIEVEVANYVSEKDDDEDVYLEEEDIEKQRGVIEKQFATLQAELRIIGVYKNNREAFMSIKDERNALIDIRKEYNKFMKDIEDSEKDSETSEISETAETSETDGDSESPAKTAKTKEE